MFRELFAALRRQQRDPWDCSRIDPRDPAIAQRLEQKQQAAIALIEPLPKQSRIERFDFPQQNLPALLRKQAC